MKFALRIFGSCADIQSPSARRAWVEILQRRDKREADPSPSARRAWVEIFISFAAISIAAVALREEGVG